MLSCREGTRLLSESQERTLGLQERLPLQMHLMMCKGCRNFGKQIHMLREMARTYAKRQDDGGEQDDR